MDVAEAGGGQPRLLFVAEPGETRALVVEALARGGHLVEVRADAPPTAADEPDLVLVDIEAPRGRDVLGLVRRRFTRTVALIVGPAAASAVDWCLDQGVFDWVVAPVDPRRLRLAVRNGLELRRLSQRLTALERAASAPTASGPARLEELERRALAEALARSGGNVSEVVRELGIGRTTVYRKLRKYGLR